MINFNLARKKPEPVELRAYLYQIINSDFNFKVGTLEPIKDRFSLFVKYQKDWDLNQIPIEEIETILRNQNVFPDEIFYFKMELKGSSNSNDDYKKIPEIFTGVEEVSFDKEGMIVFQRFKAHLFVLFTCKGSRLTEVCQNLYLGMEGKVLLKKSQNNTSSWQILHFDGNSLSITEINSSGYLNPPSDFPYIKGRDIIPEMFPVGEFPIPENYPPKFLNHEEIKKELNKNNYFYRYLTIYYQDNEELATYAVCITVCAFTLLSERLKNNKPFIINLINIPKIRS